MTLKQFTLLALAAWLVYSFFALVPALAGNSADVAQYGWVVVILGALANGFGHVVGWVVLIGLIVLVVRLVRRAAGSKTATPQVPPPSAPQPSAASAPVNEER